MKEVAFDKFVKKFLTNKIIFGIVLPAMIIIAFVAWLVFHQTEPKILAIIIRVLKVVAVFVLVPQIYKLISERNKSAKPFLIVLGILYSLLILFLFVITLFILGIAVSDFSWLALGLSIFMTFLTALNIFNLIRQIKAYREKIISDKNK